MKYSDSGVDRNAAYDFIDEIGASAKKTRREEVLSEIGDYGGFFQAPRKMKDPIFVATTDGVGTKLMLAEDLAAKIGGSAHQCVGQDAVAMCVNDLIACRAEPLIFLDYLATGKLDRVNLKFLLEGIVKACDESGCSLIGGETAQMPGFYPGSRYDVAGFSVGALERSHRMNAELVAPGDLVYGMESDGFHSNGFSLVRKIIADQNWQLDQMIEGRVLSEFLLTPTRLYVKPMLKIFETFSVRAAAHITGGGMVENLPRGFVESKVRVSLDRKSIPTSAFMKKFVVAAGLSEVEAFSTWNMGIGFCFIIPANESSALEESAWFTDLRIHRIGKVLAAEAGKPAVSLEL